MTSPERGTHHRGEPLGSASRQIGPEGIVHILSVGSVDQHNELHDLLLQLSAVHISDFTDYSDLLEVSTDERVQIAVLHESLSLNELLEASQIVRHKWPNAKIIVIRTGEEFLEDFRYDLRLFPASACIELQAHIELALYEDLSNRARVSK